MLSPWKLDGNVAFLREEGINAQVDLSQPDLGLHSIRIGEAPLNAMHLLGVRWLGRDSSDALKAPKVQDVYVRSSDLVAGYKETPSSPSEPQIYWRFLRPERKTGGQAEVESICSIKTSQLDTQQELLSLSALPDCEVFQLARADADEFVSLDRSAPHSVEPRTGIACLLFRLPQWGISYAEMVHPDDFRQSHGTTLSPEGETINLRHRLIFRWMEKGVIVRTRVRGLFCEVANDMAETTTSYRRFAGEELPLTA